MNRLKPLIISERRETAGDLMVIPIDEFKTSQNCSKCGADALESVIHVKGHSVLV